MAFSPERPFRHDINASSSLLASAATERPDKDQIDLQSGRRSRPLLLLEPNERSDARMNTVLRHGPFSTQKIRRQEDKREKKSESTGAQNYAST